MFGAIAAAARCLLGPVRSVNDWKLRKARARARARSLARLLRLPRLRRPPRNILRACPRVRYPVRVACVLAAEPDDVIRTRYPATDNASGGLTFLRVERAGRAARRSIRRVLPPSPRSPRRRVVVTKMSKAQRAREIARGSPLSLPLPLPLPPLPPVSRVVAEAKGRNSR